MPAPDYYIGLMSGTSADAIDAALVDFSESFPRVIATHSLPLAPLLRSQVHQFAKKADDELNKLAQLDHQLGELFAEVVNELLIKASIDASAITAIGSHGQTLRHCPDQTPAFTCQVANPFVISTRTGITTVADFRRKDVALGGQGAPLTPAFHAEFYRHDAVDRVVLNLGGIANVTYLPAGSEEVVGFDTGPANTLLDAWCRKECDLPYDAEGQWAKAGEVQQSLLEQMLSDEYFKQAHPKSTGVESFNLAWLNHFLAGQYEPVDVQATLLALTVRTVADAICALTPGAQILLAGGGARNVFLVDQLQLYLGEQYCCEPIGSQGVLEGDWVEAVAFAWLAKCCLERKPINLCSVTGASRSAVLGMVCWAE